MQTTPSQRYIEQVFLMYIWKALSSLSSKFDHGNYRKLHEEYSKSFSWGPFSSLYSRGSYTSHYMQQLWADTGGSLEDLPGTMDDRNGWRERVREIRGGCVTWWWWWWWWWYLYLSIFIYTNTHTHTHIYIYIYIYMFTYVYMYKLYHWYIYTHTHTLIDR